MAVLHHFSHLPARSCFSPYHHCAVGPRIALVLSSGQCHNIIAIDYPDVQHHVRFVSGTRA